MSLLAHLRGHETRTWSGPLTSSSPELARLWGAPTTSTGMGVNEETSFAYSVFWACVNNISTDIGSFPLNLYKREADGGKTLLTDHKLSPLLHDAPNPEMTAFTFRGVLTSNALTWGMGYAEVVRDGAGRPMALWPITPNRVTIRRETASPYRLYYEVTREDGRPDRLMPDQMFVLPGSTVDGVYGRNIVSMARESIGLGLAAERFGGTFFGNGATFGGVFNHPNTMTETALKNFRESVNATHGGAEKAHKFIVTEEGMTYQKLGVDPDHAQFLETRQHQIEEMCRWFRMPPHKVQHLIRTSYNSVEQMNIEYSTDTLTPWCVRWEQELKRQLIAPSERRIQFFKHNMDSKLRGDTTARYEAYTKGIQNGFLSADDVREKEDMNPLPNGAGKKYFLQSNTQPLDRVDEIIDKQVEPTPTPQAPVAPKAESDEEKERAIAEARAMVTQIAQALVDVEGKVAEHVTKAVEAETRDFATTQENLALQAEAERHRLAADEALGRANALTATLALATERANELERAHEAAQLEAAAQADALRREAEQAAELVKQHAADVETLRAKIEADGVTSLAEFAKAEGLLQVAQRSASDASLLAAEIKAAAEIEAEKRAKAESDLVAMKAQADQLDADRLAMQQTAVAAEGVIAQLQAQLLDAQARHAETVAAQAELDAAKAELVRLQAQTESSERTIAMLEAEQATLQADIATKVAAMEAAHQEREQERADLERVTKDAEQASRTLAETSALWASERDARTETAAELATRKKAEADWKQRMITTIRDAVLYHVGLLVEKETTRARSNKVTPAKLKAWAESFYLLWEDTCVDALRSDMRMHLVFIGSTQDVDAFTRSVVRPHLVAAVAQLLAVADGDPDEYPVAIERLLTRWAQDRPAAIADAILQEEVSYVRSL